MSISNSSMVEETMTLPVIIWDLDGTIVDTMPYLAGLLMRLIEEYDCQFTPTEVSEIMQSGGRIEDIFPLLGLPPEARIRWVELDTVSATDEELSPTFEGIVDFLNESQKHYAHVLVTNRVNASYETLLVNHGIDGYFVEKIAPAHGHEPKPSTAGYLKAAEWGPVLAVVGDREVDFIPARELGYSTIAYKHPELDSDYHIDNYSELSAILDSLMEQQCLDRSKGKYHAK